MLAHSLDVMRFDFSAALSFSRYVIQQVNLELAAADEQPTFSLARLRVRVANAAALYRPYIVTGQLLAVINL